MSLKNDPLKNIRIASPCPANWDEMIVDERRRYCGECKLNVYNLSGMTKAEAEKLLINSEGRLCVRYYRRADGTVLTKDCPVGWARVKRRVSRAATAVFSIMAGFLGGIASVALSEDTTVDCGSCRKIGWQDEPPVVMGAIPINEPEFQDTEPLMGVVDVEYVRKKSGS